MAIRKGRCSNFDGCPKADKDVIQEVDEHDDFVCSECGRELDEIRAPKKKGLDPKLMIIIGAVVVVGIIVALVFALGGSKEEIVEPIVVEEQTDSIAENPTAVPNRNDTLVIKVEGLESPADTATMEMPVDDAVIEETRKVESQPQQSVIQTSTSSTSKNLGYGTWTGGLKNGQPHGMGTLTYSTSHTIDSRDPKGRVAQQGEYIVGEWDNGHLVQGRWFKKDGTKEAIIVGKVG